VIRRLGPGSRLEISDGAIIARVIPLAPLAAAAAHLPRGLRLCKMAPSVSAVQQIKSTSFKKAKKKYFAG
jgi:hypothetical protein